MTPGELIRAARDRKKMSQARLALIVGVSRAAVSQWENDETGPTRAHITKVAEALDLPATVFNPFMQETVKKLKGFPRGISVPLVSLEDISLEMQGYNIEGSDSTIVVDPTYDDKCFAVILQDDSMASEYIAGEVVIVNTTVEPVDGDDVVVGFNSRPSVFRRFKRRGTDSSGRAVYDLVPLNPDYATLTIRDEDGVRILGTIVEHRRKRRAP